MALPTNGSLCSIKFYDIFNNQVYLLAILHGTVSKYVTRMYMRKTMLRSISSLKRIKNIIKYKQLIEKRLKQFQKIYIKPDLMNKCTGGGMNIVSL